MEFFDFNFSRVLDHHRAASPFFAEAVHEHGPDGFCAIDGVPSTLPVSSLRRSLSGPSLRQRFLLLGSVPLFSLRSAYRAQQSARHRNLSARSVIEALSPGLPRSCFSRHARRCQRSSRLAHLSRLRPSAHPYGPRPLPRPIFRRGLVRDRLCLRLHHHRFVSVLVPLGAVPSPQERGQAAYLAGSAGQHSDQCLRDGRAGARRQPAGSTAARSRSLLLDGPRLCGLRSPLPVHASLSVFHHPRQKEYAVLSPHLASRRSLHRPALRPNHSPDRYPYGAALSRILRRIVYFDAEKESRLIFLTNNSLLLPLTIAQLYRARWQVELFFRWIKQHLYIKAFYGTTANAVKTQVWVALSVYVLVAILKKQLGLDQSLYQILQILSVTIFEKTALSQRLFNVVDELESPIVAKQLDLLDRQSV